MKVTHFYSGNLFGGLEKLLIYLKEFNQYAPELEQKFFLCFEGTLSKNLRAIQATVEVIGKNSSLKNPISFISTGISILKYIKREKPDVFICHHFWAYAMAVLFVKISKTPIVIWNHSSGIGYIVRNCLRFFKPDLSITCSRYVAGLLTDIIPEQKIRTFYAPLPPPNFEGLKSREEIRRQFKVRENETVVLHVGRMSYYKGQRELLEALALIADHPFHVWFVGGPQQKKEEEFLDSLQEFTRQNHLTGKIEFLGQQSDVRKFYKAADIYCQPNPFPEPYGFSFIEALYWGLPVVSTDIGGAREILKNEETGKVFGALVEPNNPASLAEVLGSLIQNSDKRQECNVNGPLRAKELSDPVRNMPQLPALFKESIVNFNQ